MCFTAVVKKEIKKGNNTQVEAGNRVKHSNTLTHKQKQDCNATRHEKPSSPATTTGQNNPYQRLMKWSRGLRCSQTVAFALPAGQ